jgi:hypothetical protein
MTYDEYTQILNDNNLHIHEDNIIYKHGKGNHNRPICRNEILEDLVIKRQNGTITPKEENLLGICLLTLTKIVLNNQKFRYQSEEIRNDIRSEAYLDTLSAMENKLYDPTKGRAYSYMFRLCYVSGIHILQRENLEKDTKARLIETFQELYPEEPLNIEYTNN